MPKGPKGEWRPTSTVSAAVHVARLSTGEVQETRDAPSRPDPEADHQRARKGGKARAASMTSQQRSALGKAAASPPDGQPRREKRTDDLMGSKRTLK